MGEDVKITLEELEAIRLVELCGLPALVAVDAGGRDYYNTL